MNRLTKIIKGKCGHDQIYYTPKYGNPITPIDMTDWGYNTLANHLYDILNRLKRYEDTGLEPEEVKKLNASDENKEESSIKYYIEMRKYRDELKYYKKLEEQGLLIKLPCKVGQSLYVYNYTMGGIREFIARDKTWIFENMMSFGKEIFLTREEAEKALE